MITAPFKNQHLSYSRLSRFETCPLSYRLHYIEKQQAEPGLPLRFGKTIHAVLERLIKEAVDDERSGPLSEERAIELYREAWGAERLTGMDVFAEGLAILRRFIADQGVVDHRSVLAIEKEFRLPVGPFTVLGFIDRVDWIDDETVEVIDYKTNRLLFSREEVDTSLQMSLYHLATHPADRQRLIDEPEIMPFAIEELLRAYSPVTMAEIELVWPCTGWMWRVSTPWRRKCCKKMAVALSSPNGP